ncbi:hypothetical protein B296_00023602, partial [Ensete ventricosum]
IEVMKEFKYTPLYLYPHDGLLQRYSSNRSLKSRNYCMTSHNKLRIRSSIFFATLLRLRGAGQLIRAHVTNTFSLTFGTEVVFPTLWVKCFEEEALGKRLWENLDLFKERRAEAHLRTLTYKKVIARLYNQMVRPRHIKSDDLVLRKAEISDLMCSRGKLAIN